MAKAKELSEFDKMYFAVGELNMWKHTCYNLAYLSLVGLYSLVNVPYIVIDNANEKKGLEKKHMIHQVGDHSEILLKPSVVMHVITKSLLHCSNKLKSLDELALEKTNREFTDSRYFYHKIVSETLPELIEAQKKELEKTKWYKFVL
jgi:hypothetical protein